MSGEILQRVAERSQAVQAVGEWAFLQPVISMRNLPFADSTIIDELQEEFTPDQLEAGRLLVRRRENQLELNPFLVGESSRGLFLRRKKDALPFDVVNQNGSLMTDDPPAFGSGYDFLTTRFSREMKSILVVLSDDDLAVLRMLSLPCTPAAGLATMTGEQHRRFFEGTPGFPGATSIQKQSLVVVPGGRQFVLSGWSIAKLNDELPCGVNSVVERLVKAEDLFGFDTSHRIKIWRPTEREINRIRSAAEFEDRKLVCKLIWQSVKYSTYSARQFQEEASGHCSTDYDAARRELLWTIKRARKLGFQSSEIAKRLEDFNRSFETSVVDAIVRDAMSAPDSVNRALLLAASELMGHWHSSSSLVRSTQDGVNGRYFPQGEALQPDELNDRLRVVDGLVKIHRELTRDK